MQNNLLILYALLLVVSYILYILIDLWFPVGLLPTYRVKKCSDNQWKIQRRNFLIPFWWDIGMGDVAGLEFETVKYSTKAGALNEAARLSAKKLYRGEREEESKKRS